MLLVPRRAERRHRIERADGLQAHAVRRTLDEEHLVRLGRLSPSVLDAEEHRGFVEEQGVAAILVLRLLVAHAPGGEADDMSVAVADGDDHAVLVKVVAALVHQSQFVEKLPFYVQSRKRPAGLRRVADAFLAAVVLAPTSVGVALRLLALGKLRRVELRHLRIGHEQSLAVHALLLLVRVLLFLLYLHAAVTSQRFHGFHECQPVTLLQETDGIASLVAAEALVRAGLRKHEERGRLLPVEGTAPHEPCSRLPELHGLPD